MFKDVLLKLDVIASFSFVAVVFIGSVLFAFQQLSGINAVFYFSSTVFKSAGVPSDIGNICIGVVNISGSAAAAKQIYFGLSYTITSSMSLSQDLLLL